MDIEALSLKTGKSISDELESFPHRAEMIEPFFRPKSRRLLEESSLRGKRENFSYCLRKVDREVALEDKFPAVLRSERWHRTAIDSSGLVLSCKTSTAESTVQ